MKVFLICPILDCQPVASVGVASLATYLKRAGHEIKLLIVNEGLGFPLDLERIWKECSKFSPHITAFSSVNSQYETVIKIADYLKTKSKTPIIYGGACPTVMPQECLSNESVDFVCVGEGEEAFAELLNKYENGEDCRNIQSIWAKRDGQVIKNPIRPLGELNSFYPLDFSVYEEMEEILKHRDGWFDYSLIRGCPYQCAHCQSPYIQDIYGKNRSIRYASIDTVIENLREILRIYKGIEFFNFNDDTFNLDKKYLFEFCRKYKENIFKKYKVRFNILARVDLFDEEICGNLKEAGVRMVKFGLESGNSRIRKQILKRNISDETTIKAFKICDKYEVETWAFNMIGLPTETKEELYQTFELNAVIKPDNFWLSIYYPIEKTGLYNFCAENDLIKYDMIRGLKNYRTNSPIVSKHFEEGEIQLIYKIAGWIINSYAFPEHKEEFSRLIKEAFELKRRKVGGSVMDKFIGDNNRRLDKSLKPPYYKQKFKHIAIKVKG